MRAVLAEKAPFVGRDAELHQLGHVLARAASGVGAVVLISGEAGIGKTRLCQEVRQAHVALGGLALLGRASPDEATIRFAPLADTLRAARRTERSLWEAAKTRSAILRQVAPELGDGSVTAPRSGDRPVLFEALLDAVDEYAADRLTLWIQPTPESAAEAESSADAAPWPWLQALVGCWRGELLRDADAVFSARDRFEEMGAQLGVRRAEAVLRRLGVWLPRRASASGPLSRREMEVAELVAEGLSNPAIARRLYLSRPTVASHVAHILSKLDFSSRAQVAAWVAGRGHPSE